MILIVKVTLDNIFFIWPLFPIKESEFAPHQLRLVYTSVGKLPVHDEILKQKMPVGNFASLFSIIKNTIFFPPWCNMCGGLRFC